MRFCESEPVEVPVGIFQAHFEPSLGLRVSCVSRALLGILGESCDVAIELSALFHDFIDPEELPNFEKFLLGATGTLKPATWAGRIRVNDKLKSIRIDLSPPEKEDSNGVWIGIVQDLTDIAELQERFDSVLDAAQAYTWRRDLVTGQSQFGVRWAEFAKYENGENSIPSDEWLSKVHPDDRPQVQERVEALERGDINRATVVYRRELADGTWVWLRVHAGISERAADGKPTALSGVSFDITTEVRERLASDLEHQNLRSDLERAERALQRTAYEITENIPVGTYTMVLRPGDQLASFGFMSKRFLEITGLEEAEARADPLKAFSCVHPEDYDEWVRKNAYAFVHKRPFREEARLVVDGKVRWIVAESLPRLRNDGAWIWEGVIQDITSEKISELELRKAAKMIVELERNKAQIAEREQLLREIHDGFGNQLALGKLRLQRGAISVDDAVEVIGDCLSDLRLVIASLDGKQDHVNLWALLAELEERYDLWTDRHEIAFVWNIEAAKKIEMTSSELLNAARIVQEAIANAVRHAEARSVWITARVEQDLCQIEIRDDGKGFDLFQGVTGNGVTNMKTRAEANNWLLDLRSSSTGTSVLLDFGSR